MSLYIRYISEENHNFFKTYADLLITDYLDLGNYKKLFNHIYTYYGDSKLHRHNTSQNKYETHNKDLLFMYPFAIEDVPELFKNKNYESIEILLGNNLELDEIDECITKIYNTFVDSDVSVGVLTDSKEYLTTRKEFLENKGFYISQFSPEKIDVEYENECLKAKPEVVLLNMNCCGAAPREYRPVRIVPKKIIKLQDSFQDKLIQYLNKSKKTNVEIYTKGGINRKLFSKILSLKGYVPNKATICCLIIGMELCLDDAIDLLNAAGYTLSNSILFDCIIKNHIESKDYDTDSINIELDENGLPIIGWKPREN